MNGDMLQIHAKIDGDMYRIFTMNLIRVSNSIRQLVAEKMGLYNSVRVPDFERREMPDYNNSVRVPDLAR